MAGGMGTRLMPLTKNANKHTLLVGNQPMIQRNVIQIVDSGIRDILVLLNYRFAQGIMEILGDGEALGARILYGYKREVVSVGRHLGVAQTYIGNEPFLLFLGDSYYRVPLHLQDKEVPHIWVAPLDDDDDVQRYAVVQLSQNRQHVVGIEDGTLCDESPVVQTGAWIFPPDVFDRTRRLSSSIQDVKEVKVRTIIADYLREQPISATLLPPGSFLDLGTPRALQRANTLARDK